MGDAVGLAARQRCRRCRAGWGTRALTCGCARPGDGVACAPWPFGADAVDLPVAARMVPARPYRSARDLAGALAEAAWTTLRSA